MEDGISLMRMDICSLAGYSGRAHGISEMLMVVWLLAGYSPRDFGTICQEVEVCCPIQELQMATMSMAMAFG